MYQPGLALDIVYTVKYTSIKSCYYMSTVQQKTPAINCKRHENRSYVHTPSCRRGELSPYALSVASPSIWCVCLFRHFDVVSSLRLYPERGSTLPNRALNCSDHDDRCLSSGDATVNALQTSVPHSVARAHASMYSAGAN